MKLLTIFLSIFLFSSILFEVHSTDMSRIKGLSCEYMTSHSFYISGTLDKMIKGGGIKEDKWNLIITDIDLSNGTAKIVGNNATVDVRVLKNFMGLVFVEVTLGAFHTYVVFETKTRGMDEVDFPTIASRNLYGMSSQLLPKTQLAMATISNTFHVPSELISPGITETRLTFSHPPVVTGYGNPSSFEKIGDSRQIVITSQPSQLSFNIYER